MEKEIRNSPIYKILNHLWVEGGFVEATSITDLQKLIEEEAPETFELFEKDHLSKKTICSPNQGAVSAADDFWHAINRITDDYKKKEGIVVPENPAEYTCPNCKQRTNNINGICIDCEKDGLWIDPAGGIHQDDEEDPAAIYE